MNNLPSEECSPYCVYFVDWLTNVTYIGIPNPTPGVWTVTYFGTLKSGETDHFTITASTCGEGTSGSCSVFCAISYSSPVHVLCDPYDNLKDTITVTTGTVTGSQSGGDDFGVNSNGLPYIPPPPISTPQFSDGFVALVAVLFAGLLMVRRRQTTN